MILALNRRRSKGGYTPGTLAIDGVYECDTLEDAVRELPGKPVEFWKIPGKTAIPAGRYRVVLANSPRFGPDTLSLNNVPGFTFIRIHAGNTVDDTDGCILVGKLAGGVILGGTSGPALSKLKAKILAAILTRREEVWIDVRNYRRETT